MKEIPDSDRLSAVLTMIVLGLAGLLILWLLVGFLAWVILR